MVLRWHTRRADVLPLYIGFVSPKPKSKRTGEPATVRTEGPGIWCLLYFRITYKR